MTAFKDLCIDAVDVERMAAFWSKALGLTRDPDAGGTKLIGAIPEHTVWINAVPEPVTVKQRVHLDLHVAAVEDLLDLGARVLAETPNWTVLADPEGGEVCAFVREPAKLPAYRLYEVVVDAEDHQAISRWWADRFGVEAMQGREGGFSWIEGAPGMPWELVFQAVPEPKTVKNRIHWDLRAVTEDFVAAGAHLQRRHDHEIGWDVLTDPEGNEFCVFAPPTTPSVLHGPC
jgi:Glyoxalase-like domain